ncbi:metallophosphoesterase [Agrobacterium rubi]|nr:metallophosphoesterase [Agrobacterium rubi]NTF10700.1 metallophosphoesterase [Agrobacterium rubi]NTF23094.1 metallophosphoesterase [Agrobacterium rubi]NTF30025.1 metallophosphoesterase [Agrobacterium rubi]
MHSHTPIAVIADAHYHDLEGSFGQQEPVSGDGLTVRSWSETRCSTRVFNESFAAFPAALDAIAGRGIRHVVLLGDYSDDGQKATVQAVASLLKRYAETFSLSFYVLPGNHDGYALKGRHQTKEFLTPDGDALIITSDPNIRPSNVVVLRSETMYCAGYPDALEPLLEHGLTRSADYVHWETPFGTSDAFENRQYRLASAHGTNQVSLIDASYLVEPEDGLWLLMIDANVFQPSDSATGINLESDFIDSTGAGWNAVIKQRPYLISWIADVHRRAGDLGKMLLCFSHYPVVDVFADNLTDEQTLFGQTNIASRTPQEAVATTLLQAGMTQHFSGHIHVNGSTKRTVGEMTLTNFAVPSLVAFPPAFRLVNGSADATDIETISLGNLPVDRRLMHLYDRECERKDEPNHSAFSAKTYGDFLYAHQEALVTHRFFPREWPREMVEMFSGSTLGRLFAQLDLPPSALVKIAQSAGVDPESAASLSLLRFVTDWYALRQAQELALPFIRAENLSIYKALVVHQKEFSGSFDPKKNASATSFIKTFLTVLKVSLERAGA